MYNYYVFKNLHIFFELKFIFTYFSLLDFLFIYFKLS